MKNEVKIALNICTFQREEFIHRNLSLLQASDFSIRTTRSITEGFIFCGGQWQQFAIAGESVCALYL